MRGTSNANVRGNTRDRMRRREFVASAFGPRVRCWHCKRFVGLAFQVDRWPICGHDGGRYVRGNIVPSCARCNGTRCTRVCRRRR